MNYINSKDDMIDELRIVPCVQCGFCCTVGPCAFGKWNLEKHQCIFLTEDNLCSKYEEIIKQKFADLSPAFGSGCCSSLNSIRKEKIKTLRNI